MPVAAIDIGTNSTNLLVVDDDGTTLHRVVGVTRLGAGVDGERRLAPDAIARTNDKLTEYAATIARVREQRSTSVPLRISASSACRDATNRDEFFDLVERTIGARPELISGHDEARLAYLGATKNLSTDHMGHVVIDIGGGSTEFAYGDTELRSTHSLDVGAVRLTERHLRHDPPRPEELLNAIGDVQDLFDDLVRETPNLSGARQLIGVAGTIVTAAAVEIGLREFDHSRIHGFRFPRAAVEDVFRTLATETLDDRKHNPGLPPERADVIVGGLCVLVGLMRRWDADEIVVSAHNIMDGICAELLRESAR
ncbi:MAG: exopolyphosphatase [Ilumatobacteraceae bacterium]|jgi:exopolyphosphatase/guanosine-5'-triphosphate,3'-diphosphate pyrophosphatase